MGGTFGANKVLVLMILVIISTQCVHRCHAIPLSRSIALSGNQNQMLQKVDMEAEEAFHGRMDIESEDYPGSGANRSHEPGGGSRSPDRPRRKAP